MKVEIWSDIVCPFCYIGKTKFQKALAQFEHKDQVEVSYRTFQLDPSAPKESNLTINQYLSQKHGIPVEQAQNMNQQVVAEAKKVGLNYDFDHLVVTNSFNSLQFVYFAKAFNKMGTATERLMKAYFIEGLDISSYRVLASIAEELGLDSQTAIQALKEKCYATEIAQDRKDSQQIGLQGVPFFIFNDKYSVSGAQSIEAFLEVLNKVWAEEEQNRPKPAADGSYCADGVCHIDK